MPATKIALAPMKVAQIPKAGADFQIVEREIPMPGVGQVRIKVQACGICHSDALTKEGHWPGINYPRIPGHEIAGVIDVLGSGVAGWSAGQRVGVGWHGGHCGHCNSCRRGDFVTRQGAPQVPGITMDGGYAEYMIAQAGALALIPGEISAVDAAPLMCARIATSKSLRNSGARAGDVVAIVGIGGLGHLGIQFAAKMGFHTIAVARGAAKEPLAKKLGAQLYIDSQAQDVSAEMLKLGGAKVVLATATSGKAMAAVLGGLGVNGKLIILGAATDAVPVVPAQLIGGRQSIMGWPSGTSMDSQDTLAFSVLTGVRSINQVFPLEHA